MHSMIQYHAVTPRPDTRRHLALLSPVLADSTDGGTPAGLPSTMRCGPFAAAWPERRRFASCQ
ncbi:uncharacterized protein BDW43DRAFT_276554 [Aspergillus alliaceus]|uniref:uncharacterized protein n=1 Tax=Petromyces alliaceus TaxID=209559 RepID=UPI0012A5D5C6|nr:uncharacterized protein BDW43DRAFT_276554 [Aspergillus alliaceus]KAB8233520.1 hypothetical protein BDW43DRAFT_276554 [Aspergillus alliaceus]